MLGGLMSKNCPICGKDDMIRKITSIRTSDETKGTFSGPTGGITYSDGKFGTVGGYTTLSGRSITELANMLSPPPTPEKYTTPALYIIFPIIAVILAIVLFCSIGMALVFIMTTMVTQLIGQSDASDVIGLIIVGFLCFTPIPLLVASLFFIDRNQRVNSEKKYKEYKPAWDRAIKRWERLYYCYRDDIIFDPKYGDTCPPKLINSFVFSSSSIGNSSSLVE